MENSEPAHSTESGKKPRKRYLGRLRMPIAIVLSCAIVAGVVFYRSPHQDKKPTQVNARPTSSHRQSAIAATTSTSLAEATEPGYYLLPGGSTSIKPPSSWEVKGETNAYAAVIKNPDDANQSVYIRTIVLPNSFTPESEWNDCPSADACGPAPGQKKVSEESLAINGFNAYRVKMTSSTGNYNVVVVQGKEELANNTNLFTEFVVYGDDAASLDKLNQLVQTIKS